MVVPSLIIVPTSMVLPSRRSSTDNNMTDETVPEPEKRKAAAAFPDTPHPQKRMRETNDTPPTDTSGDTADNPDENAAGYDEVRPQI